MDKRSFIRGFGVGVLFTALILGISFVVRTSDAYVKSQALKLGMVYQDEEGEDLVFASPEPEASDDENAASPDEDKKEKTSKVTEKPKNTAKPKSTTKPKATEKVKNTAAPAASDSPQATKKPGATTAKATPKPESTKPKKTPAPTGKQTLTIVAGEWSSDVSEKLEKMGIVKNAKLFDKYLNDNGYSERINAGTYSVSPDDTYEELARKITKK